LKITVGIPAFNEEKNIAAIIVKLKKIADNVIVCNDGSTDATGIIAEELGAIVINHTKNQGYGAGIRSIFLKSKEIESDVLVTLDSDGQHDVDEIKKLIEPIENKKCDLVIGSRFLEDNVKNVPNYRKIGINIITKVTNTTLKNKLTDSQSGYRAYNKKVISEITPSELGMGVSTEILIKASNKEFVIGEVPITVSYEGNTSTHNPVSHGTSVLFSTLKFTSIEHPLKFYGIPAAIFLIVGITFVVWSIQIFSEGGRLVTNITLIGATMTILGVILSVAAILLYSLVSVVRENNSK
jgi:glycosyltransferase involved in cell wall biosynthesis|tara:strand:+ start:4268 stop:5155 length:888 start_codon:yes stop_codon:yes gene_type:complete